MIKGKEEHTEQENSQKYIIRIGVRDIYKKEKCRKKNKKIQVIYEEHLRHRCLL
jgi:hypothetical protein